MRKPSLKGLKFKLWNVFSKVIRMRDADEDGRVKCITCPQRGRWQDFQAGHCIPKSLGLSIYFDERNVRPQCPSCNVAFQGRQHEFVEALKEIYGDDIYEELKAQQRNIRQIKRWEYIELIDKYKTELKNLEARQSGIIFGAR